METTNSLFAALLEITEMAQKWMGTNYRYLFPATQIGAHGFNRNATQKTRHSPEHTEFVLARELHILSLERIHKVLGLERCAVIRPCPHRQGFWKVVHHLGVPEDIVEQSLYTKGEGLTGKVLTGQTIHSTNILKDARYSNRYGGKWTNQQGVKVDSTVPRSYLGVPLWIQQTESETEPVGAIYAIRESDPFSDTEIQFLTLVARAISFGHDRLRSWRRRAESDLRHLRLSETWQTPMADSYRYSEVLRLLRQEFPFPRMLLSLSDELHNRIRGVAAIGFRNDIVSETNRPLGKPASNAPLCTYRKTLHRGETATTADSRLANSKSTQMEQTTDSQEDILTWMYSTKQATPLIIRDSPSDDHWKKVNKITAFRHEIHGPLLLVPLVGSSDSILGVLVAELPHQQQITPNELGHISHFMNHAAHLIETHRKRLRIERAMETMETWKSIQKTVFTSTSFGPHYEHLSQVSKVLQQVCSYCNIGLAILYSIDEKDRALRGIAAVGIEENNFRQKFIPVTFDTIDPDLSPIAIRAIKGGSHICCSVNSLFDKHRSIDQSVPDCFGIATGARVAAVPTFGPEGCNGVIIVLDQFSHDHCMAAESLLPLASAIGNSLSLYQCYHRLSFAERSASAFQSLAFAIKEIGRRDVATSYTPAVSCGSSQKENPQGEESSIAIRSVLRDTAAMFNAELAQMFLLEQPVTVVDSTEKSRMECFHGKILKNVGQYIVADEDLPMHFHGRIKSIKEPRHKIAIGPSKGLTTSVLMSLGPVISRDVVADPFWSQTQLELCGCRSFLGVPLYAHKEGSNKVVFGVLSLTRLRMNNSDSRAFRVDESDALQNVASLLAATLNSFDKSREVEHRVNRILKWVSHDIPSFFDYLEIVFRSYARGEVSLDDTLSLADAIKLICNAMVTGLDGSRLIGGLETAVKATLPSKSSAIVHEIERFVRALMSLEHRPHIDLQFMSSGDCIAGIPTPILLYTTYTLVQNAFHASDLAFNRNDESAKRKRELRLGDSLLNTVVTDEKCNSDHLYDAPETKRVLVEFVEDNDGKVVLRVTDEGGGTRGATWEQLSEEGCSKWGEESKSHASSTKTHFGLGLYILRRLIEGRGLGSVVCNDIVHPNGRTGARFTVQMNAKFGCGPTVTVEEK